MSDFSGNLCLSLLMDIFIHLRLKSERSIQYTNTMMYNNSTYLDGIKYFWNIVKKAKLLSYPRRYCITVMLSTCVCHQSKLEKWIKKLLNRRHATWWKYGTLYVIFSNEN